MSNINIKLQEQAHVSTISRSDSGIFDQIELVDNINRLRPQIDTRLSNDDITKLIKLETHGHLEPLPNQQVDKSKNIMTANNPKRNLWRICAICIWSIAGGFSDAAPGALLPNIEAYYNITYSIVSLIWMSNAAGFILIACLSHKIQPWLGKKNSLTLGCMFSCVMYGIVASGSRFPLIVVGFFFGGIGLAIVLAQSNIFLARLDKQSKYLSFFHGSYGIGAMVSPLIATSMVNRGIKWHYFYLLLLGLMVFNTVNLWLAFKGADEDLKPWDNEEFELTIETENSSLNNSLDEDAIELQELDSVTSRRRRPSSKVAVSQKGEMVVALKSHITWLISFFVLFYQGSEVSLAGWIVTYLLDYRHGDSSTVGYVASGFWGGLTIGRLLLTRPLHKTFGVRRSVIMVSICAIVLVLLTWVIPNVITAGIFVSLAGILIGPNYPLLITVSAQLVPRKIQVVSLTIMTAFGSSGGAIFPFLVGLISQKSGTYVVLPIFISLYTSMLFLWLCLPNMERRQKQPNINFNIWQRLW